MRHSPLLLLELRTEAARRVDAGLTVYRGVADKPELIREMLSILDECKTCCVLPEDTFRAAAELREEDAALADKLSDLVAALHHV